MKKSTIKWRIFKYNIIVIFLLISITTVVFNIAIRMYIEKDIISQLEKIAERTEYTALKQGPDYFPNQNKAQPPPNNPDSRDSNNFIRYYFLLDRSLREPLSVLNADYMLLSKDKILITNSDYGVAAPSSALVEKIVDEVIKHETMTKETYMNFDVVGTEYVAIIKPVYDKNSFGLGWIIIYSSLQKMNQMQIGINVILLGILIISALLIVLLSSVLSKKISAPFSSLNEHIRSIAERNFGTKLQVPVDDELSELVNNINTMSEKLESYDKAQKTFLQNASHEFRTPIMSIQSYAEGIKYEVIDKNSAVDIILDESKRLTSLVEDLLYLSRLDSIEENYRFMELDFNDFVESCIERMKWIALKNNVSLVFNSEVSQAVLYGDEEKLSRAINNIISNCLRYAASTVTVSLELTEESLFKVTISDDGPGFDANELPSIFERFYKGKKGNYGLGLTITKNIIEKHNGKITAFNSDAGAIFEIELPLHTPRQLTNL